MLNWKRAVTVTLAAMMIAGTVPAIATGPNPAEEAEEAMETAALATPESTETPAIRLEEIRTDDSVVVDVIIDNTPYLVTADVEIGLQNAELGAVTSMPGGHVVYERESEGYLLRWRRTDGSNAAEGTTIIATVGIANSNGDTLITATCKDCRVTDAAIATEVAPSELHLTAALTPILEATGMGAGLGADYYVWVGDYRPTEVESITFWAELPENLRVCDVSTRQEHRANVENGSFSVTVDVPERMGIVEPVRVILHASLAGNYDITFRCTIHYRTGGTAELSTNATMFATPIVEMWEFYGDTAIAFVHGMAEEVEGLTAFLVTYSPEGQMLNVRTARVEYTEAVTGPCGRVQFKLTQACEMQEGNSQQLFFLDSACRPVLSPVEVPNGTMRGVHLGPNAYQPAA